MVAARSVSAAYSARNRGVREGGSPTPKRRKSKHIAKPTLMIFPLFTRTHDSWGLGPRVTTERPWSFQIVWPHVDEPPPPEDYETVFADIEDEEERAEAIEAARDAAKWEMLEEKRQTEDVQVLIQEYDMNKFLYSDDWDCKKLLNVFADGDGADINYRKKIQHVVRNDYGNYVETRTMTFYDELLGPEDPNQYTSTFKLQFETTTLKKQCGGTVDVPVIRLMKNVLFQGSTPVSPTGSSRPDPQPVIFIDAKISTMPSGRGVSEGKTVDFPLPEYTCMVYMPQVQDAKLTLAVSRSDGTAVFPSSDCDKILADKDLDPEDEEYNEVRYAREILEMPVLVPNHLGINKPVTDLDSIDLSSQELMVRLAYTNIFKAGCGETAIDGANEILYSVTAHFTSKAVEVPPPTEDDTSVFLTSTLPGNNEAKDMHVRSGNAGGVKFKLKNDEGIFTLQATHKKKSMYTTADISVIKENDPVEAGEIAEIPLQILTVGDTGASSIQSLNTEHPFVQDSPPGMSMGVYVEMNTVLGKGCTDSAHGDALTLVALPDIRRMTALPKPEQPRPKKAPELVHPRLKMPSAGESYERKEDDPEITYVVSRPAGEDDPIQLSLSANEPFFPTDDCKKIVAGSAPAVTSLSDLVLKTIGSSGAIEDLVGDSAIFSNGPYFTVTIKKSTLKDCGCSVNEHAGVSLVMVVDVADTRSNLDPSKPRTLHTASSAGSATSTKLGKHYVEFHLELPANEGDTSAPSDEAGWSVSVTRNKDDEPITLNVNAYGREFFHAMDCAFIEAHQDKVKTVMSIPLNFYESDTMGRRTPNDITPGHVVFQGGNEFTLGFEVSQTNYEKCNNLPSTYKMITTKSGYIKARGARTSVRERAAAEAEAAKAKAKLKRSATREGVSAEKPTDTKLHLTLPEMGQQSAPVIADPFKFTVSRDAEGIKLTAVHNTAGKNFFSTSKCTWIMNNQPKSKSSYEVVLQKGDKPLTADDEDIFPEGATDFTYTVGIGTLRKLGCSSPRAQPGDVTDVLTMRSGECQAGHV